MRWGRGRDSMMAYCPFRVSLNRWRSPCFNLEQKSHQYLLALLARMEYHLWWTQIFLFPVKTAQNAISSVLLLFDLIFRLLQIVGFAVAIRRIFTLTFCILHWQAYPPLWCPSMLYSTCASCYNWQMTRYCLSMKKARSNILPLCRITWPSRDQNNKKSFPKAIRASDLGIVVDVGKFYVNLLLVVVCFS